MPETDQGYDKEKVNFWVDPEQKERWEEYLEEQSEYQYLSQVVRKAIEREIQRSSDGKSAELAEEVEAYFEDLSGSVNQLEQVVQEARTGCLDLNGKLGTIPSYGS